MILIYLQKIIKMIIIQLLRINNLEKYVHSKYTIANKNKNLSIKTEWFFKVFFFWKVKKINLLYNVYKNFCNWSKEPNK